MSASPVARSITQSQSIPTRHVIINSASQLPNDYSSTPGGTLYSCTPGGTRIVYERNFLLQMRNSPMSKTPPKNIHYIPGFSPNKVISPSKVMNENNNTHKLAQRQNSPDKMRVSPTIAQNNKEVEQGEQFEMDL